MNVQNLLFNFFMPLISPFNIDYNLINVFHGENDSYFGYTAQFLNVSGEIKLVVSAPFDKSTGSNYTSLPLLFCKLSSQNCSRFNIPTSYNAEGSYNGHWLGISLETISPTKVLACSHLRTDIIDRSPGSCYKINGEMNDMEYTPFQTKAREDVIRVQTINDGKRVWVVHEQLAQSGISAHVLQDNSGIVLGAVGLRGWEGGTIHYVNDNKFQVLLQHQKDYHIESEGYAGFSVTSGKFFSDGKVYIAIGAPRFANNGKVFIYSIPDPTRLAKILTMDIVSDVGDIEMGEYFGASVCSISVKKTDTVDLLLVGAPLYAGSTYEEGRVYIFKVDESAQFYLRTVEILLGSKEKGSRFGSAITSVKDLNLDSYQDVAIGAPYEDDGMGAVYIYFGTYTGMGFSQLPSQIIRAKSLPIKLNGFGISITNSIDVDKNEYPDFAVGSFLSDNVVLFRTRPVIELDANITSFPALIPIKSKNCSVKTNTCFELQICLSYEGVEGPTEIDVKYKLEVEYQRLQRGKPGRAFLFSYGSLANNTVTVSSQGFCLPKFSVRMSNNEIDDYENPVTFKLTYCLDEDMMVKKTKNKRIEGFQPTIAMVENTVNEVQIILVYFAQLCGDRGMCATDLSIITRLNLPSTYLDPNYFEKNQLELDVTITHKNETAIDTKLFITSNGMIVNIQVLSQNYIKCDKVMCQLNNIINERQINFKIILKMFPKSNKNLTISLHVNSTSIEINMADNTQNILIPIFEEVDITGVGVTESLTTEHCKKNEQICFISQTYKVQNYGKYTIKGAVVDIMWPQVAVDENLKLFYFPVMNLTPGCEIVHNEDGIQRNSVTNKQNIIRTDTEPNLNCVGTELQCDVYARCNWNNIGNGFEQKVTISAQVNIDAFNKLWKDVFRLTVTTSTNLTIRYDLQPTAKQFGKHRPDNFQTTSSIRFGHPFPLLYVILGAVIGLLFLIIMLFILIKFGFFTRKDKTKLERLRNQAQDCMERILDTDDIDNQESQTTTEIVDI